MVLCLADLPEAFEQLASVEGLALLQELDACENPAHCPHGRPTWLRWGIRELEKSFKR